MTFGAHYGDIYQMGYITRDMEAAKKHARDVLGIDNFFGGESSIEVLSYGEVRPLRVNAAMANIGSRQFELVEPISGAIEIYTETLDLSAHIINFHHVSIAVRGTIAHWRSLLADLKSGGEPLAIEYPVALQDDATFGYCYDDTRKQVGHFTEYLWAGDPATSAPFLPESAGRSG
jgi:hypothetical protein